MITQHVAAPWKLTSVCCWTTVAPAAAPAMFAAARRQGVHAPLLLDVNAGCWTLQLRVHSKP
jgi:hypothetical protein